MDSESQTVPAWRTRPFKRVMRLVYNVYRSFNEPDYKHGAATAADGTKTKEANESRLGVCR